MNFYEGRASVIFDTSKRPRVELDFYEPISICVFIMAATIFTGILFNTAVPILVGMFIPFLLPTIFAIVVLHFDKKLVPGTLIIKSGVLSFKSDKGNTFTTNLSDFMTTDPGHYFWSLDREELSLINNSVVISTDQKKLHGALAIFSNDRRLFLDLKSVGFSLDVVSSLE